MPNVIHAGQDLGDITDPALLAYYRREPGAVVDGVPTPVPAVPVEDDAEVEDVDGQPERPAKSASKSDWYDYASVVDPDVPAYDDITAAELVERYGGE